MPESEVALGGDGRDKDREELKLELERIAIDREVYRRAIERVLPELPVENGAIDVNSIWIETSLPRDLIIEIVKEGRLKLPANVERIVLRHPSTMAAPASKDKDRSKGKSKSKRRKRKPTGKEARRGEGSSRYKAKG